MTGGRRTDMTLAFARWFADSAAALGHLTAAELALAALELAIGAAALTFVGAPFRRPRQAFEEAADLDEAA
jgi:hypothetical protein